MKTYTNIYKANELLICFTDIAALVRNSPDNIIIELWKTCAVFMFQVLSE